MSTIIDSDIKKRLNIGDRSKRISPLEPGFADDFGAFLLGKGALDELAFQRSRRAANQSGERFDHVLTKLGLISDKQLWENLALFLGIPQIELSDIPEQKILSEFIPEKFISANRILPI